MRLILVGCEYSGTTTFADAISEWAERLKKNEIDAALLVAA